VRDIYPVLMLDGVVLARKTGAGAIRRPVLVALGLRADGRKEIIDYRLAAAESAAQWEQFLSDLWRRGLEGARLEMICADGGAGLLAALPTVYPGIPVQRCWAHKIRNVLGKVKAADQQAVKQALHRIMNADTRPQARSAARRFGGITANGDRQRYYQPQFLDTLGPGAAVAVNALMAAADASHREPLRKIEREFRNDKRIWNGAFALSAEAAAAEIHHSGRNLLEIINDVLDLSKVEAGKLDLHDEIVDVGRVMSACLAIVKERVDSGGLTLDYKVPADLQPLRADERKVKQIVLNLLSNAVKFAPRPGRIAPENLPKALAPFTQVESALSRKYAGTGLGLSLTTALVELHGGAMDLASELHVGTTVTVRFPAERVCPRSATAA
jgi:signal transduction histidine kinase